MSVAKILAANRGEIARRVFRTCREMGISTVAVYSEPDAGEPHAHEADEAVLLPGAEAADTYLNIEAVLDAAERAGADAVHPGYGFLAERADFAKAVTEAGLTWIGPSPETIEIMGSKPASKALMKSVGVPTLESVEPEGSTEVGGDVAVGVEADGPVGGEAAEAAAAAAAAVKAAAASIGYPLMVKASAGGGGKGMRVVEGPDLLLEAVEGARREAAAAFGDGSVFLERYLDSPRHVEIQVVGDTHGNVISLYERECSIQRRHQKIIEESPSPAVGEDMRRDMGEAAVRAAKAVGYVGAGTVEFLVQGAEFHFLEMNTRLQVEHPVTEMVTGLDLVRLQIEVAEGAALCDEIPPIDGHAIEARLCAEDPLNDFLPVTGGFDKVWFPEREGLRVDSGVESGSKVSVHYDPMIAKVVAHASTRDRAAAALSSALRKAHIHGSTTNRSLLVRVLEHPEFLLGETDTGFLDRHGAARLGRPLLDAEGERRAAAACALADQALERASARVSSTISSGWRNSPSALQHRAFDGRHGRHDVRYSASAFEDEVLGEVVVVAASAGRVALSVGGVERRFKVARYGDLRFVDSDEGPARLVEAARFPAAEAEGDEGALHAPMPGKVVSVEAGVGDSVAEGQVLVVLEAMKMEHTLRAPHAGTVTAVRREAGDQVEADEVLVVVD